MLRTNLNSQKTPKRLFQSAVPPNFRSENLLLIQHMLYAASYDNGGILRWYLLGNFPFNPQLKGAFYATVVKISTNHLLSDNPANIYYSLSQLLNFFHYIIPCITSQGIKKLPDFLLLSAPFISAWMFECIPWIIYMIFMRNILIYIIIINFTIIYFNCILMSKSIYLLYNYGNKRFTNDYKRFIKVL